MSTQQPSPSANNSVFLLHSSAFCHPLVFSIIDLHHRHSTLIVLFVLFCFVLFCLLSFILHLHSSLIPPSSGTIYVAPVDPLSFQDGSSLFPFYSLQFALDSIKSLSQNITIQILPGTYSIFSEYTISPQTFASVIDFQFGFPRSSISSRRTLKIVSQGGAAATKITCDSEEISVLMVKSNQVGFTSTLTLVLDGITFDGCNRALSFAGEALVVKNSVFVNMKMPASTIVVATTYSVEVSASTFTSEISCLLFFLPSLVLLLFCSSS